MESPTRSFAAVAGLAIVGGESHEAAARGVEADRFRGLEVDLRAWCDVGADGFRWSAQDPMSIDRPPIVGPYLPGSSSLWVATGYGKWGLSTGTIAARILADRILGRENAYASLFAPTRVDLRSTASLAKLAGKVALDLVGDRRHAARGHRALHPPRLPGAVQRRGDQLGLPVSRLSVRRRRRGVGGPRRRPTAAPRPL